jgi:hypothetical protein
MTSLRASWTVLLAAALPLAGCPEKPCGGTLEEACEEHGCPAFSEYDPTSSGYRAQNCGEYDVVYTDDLFGQDWWYDQATGELIGMRVFSDVEEVCGGYSAWYGEGDLLTCDNPVCIYGTDEPFPAMYTGEELQPCE